MERFESILISYDNKDRVVYQVYAEFLRLMGIYVCEDIIYDQKAEAEKVNWIDSDFSLRYHIRETDEWNISDEEVRKKLLLLKEWLAAHIQDPDFFECYDDVCSIFVANHLLWAATVLQYYKINTEEVAESGDRFEKAADDLTHLLKSKEEFMNNRYARYANLYCKQKANCARYFCEKPLVYYVDKLASQGLRLAKKFDDFSNAWVLLGLICERSKSFLLEAVDAYRRAIQRVADKPYAASIYYFLGKCYEEAENRISPYARKQYEKAYQSVKKYRNIYKMAMPYKDERKWNEAVLYFQECIQYLEYKGSFLDPIEHEYYFKVSVLMSYCFLQQEEYFNTMKYAEKALKLKKKLADGLVKENADTEFYRKLYGDQAERYIRLTLNRMNDTKIRRYLAVAHLEMQMPEEGYFEVIQG